MKFKIDEKNYCLCKWIPSIPLNCETISIISLQQLGGWGDLQKDDCFYVLCLEKGLVYFLPQEQLSAFLEWSKNCKICCYDFASLYWRHPEIWQTPLQTKNIYDIGLLYKLHELASIGAPTPLKFEDLGVPDYLVINEGNNIDTLSLSIHRLAIQVALNTYREFENVSKKIDAFFNKDPKLSCYCSLKLSYHIQLQGDIALKRISQLGIGFDQEAKDELVKSKATFCTEMQNGITTIESFEGHRLHTTFNTLISTGRVSCKNPNLQGISKLSEIRKCFVPAPGHVFLNIDYSTIELCALAQICTDTIAPYGEVKKMGQLINADVDLHVWCGSKIFSKPLNMITEQERSLAKSCNFGFSGGMGVETFRKNLQDNITLEEAKKLKKDWLNTFPEMVHYLKDPLWIKYVQVFGNDRSYYDFRNIVSGKMIKKYSQQTIDWAFKALTMIAPKLPKVCHGDPVILRMISNEDVITRTGRIRANASYTESKNTKFQGLTADGVKIALYNLVAKHQYRVVNFIHDEVLLEIPIHDCNQETFEKVNKIMIDSMKLVIPKIKIKTSGSYYSYWGSLPINLQEGVMQTKT